MLQYDLTETEIFEATSREGLPTEAELFAVTVGLLLIREVAYSDIERRELWLHLEDVPALAQCIEFRLSPLARDSANPAALRQRLNRLVGLRIAGDMLNAASPGIQETLPTQNAFEQQG